MTPEKFREIYLLKYSKNTCKNVNVEALRPLSLRELCRALTAREDGAGTKRSLVEERKIIMELFGAGEIGRRMDAI